MATPHGLRVRRNVPCFYALSIHPIEIHPSAITRLISSHPPPRTVRECSCDALLPACHACMPAGVHGDRDWKPSNHFMSRSRPALPSAASVYVVARGRTHAGGASEPVVRQRRRHRRRRALAAPHVLVTGERWRRGGMACLPACPVQLDSSPMLLETVILASASARMQR